MFFIRCEFSHHTYLSLSVTPSIKHSVVCIFSELIKNKSLEFFGSTLPILKKDPTLPKVARFQKQGKIKHHA